MSDMHSQFGKQLTDTFPEATTHIAYEELTLTVPVTHIYDCLRVLHDDFGFSMCIDITAVDYSAWKYSDWKTSTSPNIGFSRARAHNTTQNNLDTTHPERFAVVYHLLSIEHNSRIRVKSYVRDEEIPRIDSVHTIWHGVIWFEREVFDMFGIVFVGNPDMRRILTDYAFSGHPLRKDFPLIGETEVRYDEKHGRVIYEPVSIEERVNVPRVIREDNRYAPRRQTDNTTT